MKKCSFQQMLVPFFFLFPHGPTSARSNEGMLHLQGHTKWSSCCHPAPAPHSPRPTISPLPKQGTLSLVLDLSPRDHALPPQSLKPHQVPSLPQNWMVPPLNILSGTAGAIYVWCHCVSVKFQLSSCRWVMQALISVVPTIPSPVVLHLACFIQLPAWLLKTFRFDTLMIS